MRRSKDKVQKRRSQKAIEAPTSLLFSAISAFYWLALFFFALGLMSKAMLVTLPCVMLLLDYWPLQSLWSLGTLGILGHLNHLAIGEGENSVLCPRGGGERCDLRGAEARRRCDDG